MLDEQLSIGILVGMSVGSNYPPSVVNVAQNLKTRWARDHNRTRRVILHLYTLSRSYSIVCPSTLVLGYTQD